MTTTPPPPPPAPEATGNSGDRPLDARTQRQLERARAERASRRSGVPIAARPTPGQGPTTLHSRVATEDVSLQAFFQVFALSALTGAVLLGLASILINRHLAMKSCIRQEQQLSFIFSYKVTMKELQKRCARMI